jgi:hypothetical protein
VISLSLTDIAQRSEKRVPVSCDRDVSLLTRQRGAREMPDRTSQSPDDLKQLTQSLKELL